MTTLSENDWKILLPDTPFVLGETTLKLKPLTLSKVGPVLDKVVCIYKLVRVKGNILDNSSISSIAKLLVSEVPELLSEMSGLDIKDIKKLPGIIAIDLAAACIDLNIQSNENFLKNLLALASKIAKLKMTIPKL